MIQVQLKVRMTKAQEKEAERWIFHLASVYNWAIRKIELNAANKIYFSQFEFKALLNGHSAKMGIPLHTLRGVLDVAHGAWQRCFKKLARKPRLKGLRNRTNSIPFPRPLRPPVGNRIKVEGLGSLRFHGMEIPEGQIKCSRLVKRSSGWYLCLFVEAEPNAIARLADGSIGIDPGFGNLLTTSDGEIIEHPRELEASQDRLAQAQRGGNKHLAARLSERIQSRRKDRNHKLSRRLVSENTAIAFSKDSTLKIARRFGKSVTSSAHYQLRQMLAYKSRLGGTRYVEVDSKNSTRTCSACGVLSGPSGLAGLSVRQWVCKECGTSHDRDVNAARNALIVGAGLAHERLAYA